MAAPAEPAFEFSEQQDRVIAGLASAIKLLAIMILGLAALRVVFGAIEIFTAGFWTGLWYTIEGLVTALLGLIMIAGATDTGFIVDTTGYDKPHLLNAFTSLTVFYKVQIGIALFIGVITLFRIF